jgi:uncharacterized protein with beta-barrel porin domain
MIDKGQSARCAADKTGISMRTSRRKARHHTAAGTLKLTVATAAAALLAATGAARAQIAPSPLPTSNNTQLAASASQLDLGSSFLQRLGREATSGFAARDNSGGGGASRDNADPIYRTWGEGYGIDSRTDPQGAFVGDRRHTFGGVAGIGAVIAPGLSVGFSVDHSRTEIDVPLARQNAGLDMTQIGVNAAYSRGPWTVAFAAVHGFGHIDSTRWTFSGNALASYSGHVDGVLGEINYTYAFGQSRIVPKLALEYVAAHTDRFAEAGGFNPVAVAAANGERARLLAGAEIGHYWIIGQQAVDVSAYGKFVDNFSQTIDPVQVSLASGYGTSISVQGIRESATGADAGASASYILSGTARLYANYDGKFRGNFTSHQGTFGVELKW